MKEPSKRFEGINPGQKREALWWYLSANLNEPEPLLIDVDGEVVRQMVEDEVWVFGPDVELAFPGAGEAVERLRVLPPGLYVMEFSFVFCPDSIEYAYPAWNDVMIRRVVPSPTRL